MVLVIPQMSGPETCKETLLIAIDFLLTGAGFITLTTGQLN